MAHLVRWFTHWKWWFSIVFFVCLPEGTIYGDWDFATIHSMLPEQHVAPHPKEALGPGGWQRKGNMEILKQQKLNIWLIYIYIYIERSTCTYMYIYTYLHIYICFCISKLILLLLLLSFLLLLLYNHITICICNYMLIKQIVCVYILVCIYIYIYMYKYIYKNMYICIYIYIHIYIYIYINMGGGCCERQNLSCKLPFLYSTSCLLRAEHET